MTGFHCIALRRSTIQAIWDDVGEYRQRLTEMSGRNGGMNSPLALPQSGRFRSEISAYLDRAGIVAGCSLARRQALELSYCASGVVA